jgi:hypothetical protein
VKAATIGICMLVDYSVGLKDRQHWAAAKRIPSCKGASGGALDMVIHSSEPLRLRRVSS